MFSKSRIRSGKVDVVFDSSTFRPFGAETGLFGSEDSNGLLDSGRLWINV